MATALILGANGFVGPWLARELSSLGYRVCGSDIQGHPSERLKCDLYHAANLLDIESLKRLMETIHPDQVYNLAAVSSVGQSWRNPAQTMRVNVEGVVNLLEICRTMNPMPRVLLVGSSEEYAPSTEALSENSPIAANNPYGISKETQGRLANMYFHEYGLPIYRVRAFNHTGPGQAPTFVLSSWCRQAAEIEMSGCSGTIKVGNLDVARDFSDVRDVVRAYRMLLESNHAGAVFNVGSGTALPLRVLLSIITGFTKQHIKVEIDSMLLRRTDNAIIKCNNENLVKLLGWSPAFALETTLFDLYTSFFK